MATAKKPAAVSASSVLASIAKIGTEKPKGAAKQSKWVMKLTPEAENLARRWIEAKSVHTPVETRLNSSKGDFNEYALREMANKLFETKSRPSNPLCLILNSDGSTLHQFQFVMADRFSYDRNMPKDADPVSYYINLLTGVGLTHQNATALVESEFNLAPVVGFKPLNELLEGHFIEGREFIPATDTEKSAGLKLASYLQWDGSKNSTPEALTDDERAAAVQCSSGLTVNAGFLDRVATYCRNVDELMGVFKIIKPTVYPNYLKFGITESESARVMMRQQNANEILGSTMLSDEDDN